ncbi:MAG: choice-of-anchor B family protein [Gammaproteobacteria bacterium]
MLAGWLAGCGGGSGGSDSRSDSLGAADCVAMSAAGFPCSNVNLLARVGLADLQADSASDVWGWNDGVSGREYALVGLFDRTAFVDLSDPHNPRVVGFMMSASGGSPWRDIKVIGDFAYVVADGVANHGIQIIDLTRLRAIASPPETLLPDLVYAGFDDAHNIVANADLGLVYATGTNTCNGGLHVVDVNDPMAPTFLGCFSGEYVHDAQCVVYAGPDPDHQGKDICFGSDEDFFTIIDMADKQAPVVLDHSVRADHDYVHQGWLTEDQRYFLLGDEADEVNRGRNTTTYVYDVADLDAMVLVGLFTNTTASIDHNLYVLGNHVFEANYTSGLRILRIGNLALNELVEIASFDTVASTDARGFVGAWTAFPFFASGIVVVSDADTGLYVLEPDLAAVTQCADGIDNDVDALIDLADPQCVDAADNDESQ